MARLVGAHRGRGGLRPTTALIVDHGLQAGSAQVAATARRQAMELGCVDAQVLCVQVGADGGLEAAARAARYEALQAARGDRPVLLAHTLDDQAETVLLGLGRGSGARSIAGMRPHDPPWCRPLLGLRRAVTHAACDELGLAAWHDPHNSDRRFTRTRLRQEVLPLLEEVLGGGSPKHWHAPRRRCERTASSSTHLRRRRWRPPPPVTDSTLRHWPRCPTRFAGGSSAAGCWPEALLD
ncbi:tRNA(Ile)-lysidine synthetase [Mycobacterium xenopi 4042]|uniref:tRNA(Ile)-lysidine synthetase n=1 Tax=Mycobacterium xenopi 4042 TaxID=1299334 RepID=X7ZVG8_MYCXE|nr:tRNA(Ile)-lysidine synthetase [Mycobacterium xenopi 4042]